MADVLEDIVASTRQRVAALKKQVSHSELEKQVRDMSPTRGFLKALRRTDGLAIIAELKQASPSAGLIRQESDLAGRIGGYGRGGASALSILTEEHYFHGSPEILVLARRESKLPILRKDFIIDPFQIEESRVMGADAILLICALLSVAELKEFMQRAQSVTLDTLVEVHDEADLEKAMTVEAPLIGINHRNLRTLKIDLNLSEALLREIPLTEKTIVLESGIRAPEDVSQFRALGVQAVLIGESLMRHPNAEEIVRSFVRAGQFTQSKTA